MFAMSCKMVNKYGLFSGGEMDSVGAYGIGIVITNGMEQDGNGHCGYILALS